MKCRLAIPESFYIDETGHFNAVEFNLCYNQMYYLLTAQCTAAGLFPALSTMTTERCLERLLPDALIHEFHSTFKAPMERLEFEGRIAFHTVVERKGFIYFKTSAAFWDAQGGHCHGHVSFVMVDHSAASKSAGGAGA